MPSQLLRGSAAEATTHLSLALNGTVPGNAIYSSYTAEFARVGEFQLANAFAAAYGNKTNAELATQVLGNLGVTATSIGATSYQTLSAAVETAFAAYPTARGQVALNLARLLSGLEGDATYGAAATAWNSNAATAFTYSSNSANLSSTTIAALNTPAVPVDRDFTLTTSSDKGTAFTGGSGNDTFSGVQGTASTYQVGDVLDGGAGNDTLSITLRADPDDVGAVTIRGIETVVANVQATDATGGALDASMWTGVTTLSNAGSTAGSLLSVSGLALTTVVNVSGNTDVTLAYRGDLSGTSDAVSLQLDKAGVGTAATLSSTADVSLMAGIDAVNISLVGSSFASIDGADVTSITLTGTGEAVINTNDAITVFDASALAGTNVFNFSGQVTTLSAKGGAGNDTFTFNTGGLSNADTIAGNGGTDTIRATVGGGTASPTLTGFETGTFLFTNLVGNILDLSTNTEGWAGLTVSASAAGSDIQLLNVVAAAAGLTVSLNDSTVADFSLDTNAGATVTINAGSALGPAGIGTLEVTDATNLTVVASNATGAETINLIDAPQATTLTIRQGGEGTFTVGDINASAASTVVIANSGTAAMTISDGLRNMTALSSVTIRAEGSDGADLTFGAGLFSGSGAVALDTVSITATTGADITVESINLATDGTGAAASAGRANSVDLTITVGASSLFGAAAAGDTDISGAGAAITLNLNAQASGDIVLGDVIMEGTGVGSVVVNASLATGASITIDDVSGSAIPFTLSAGALASGATLNIGNVLVTGAAVSLGTINLANSASAAVGAIGASSLGALNVSGADNTDFSLGAVTATRSMGALTVNLGTAASAGFGGFHVGTSAGPVSVTLASGAVFEGNSGGLFISAGKSISTVTVNVGTGVASAGFGTIGASAIGTVDIGLKSAATASFDGIAGSGTNASGGSINSINVSGAGIALVSDIHTSSGGSIGSINVNMTTGAASATFTLIGAGEETIDAITVTVATGADVNFTKIDASAINSITVTMPGAASAEMVVSGSRVTTADFSAASGTIEADFGGVAGGIVINAGAGTNVIVVGAGNDTINLKTAAATDSIIIRDFTAGYDTINNFEAGTSRDVINIFASGFSAGGTTLTRAGSAAAGIATGTVAVDLGIVSGVGATALNAADNIVILATGQFTSVADMRSAIATGGSIELTLASATAGSLMVVWQDTSGNSVVSVVAVGADATGIGSAASAGNVAILNGVTPGAVVAANFDYTAGGSF